MGARPFSSESDHPRRIQATSDECFSRTKLTREPTYARATSVVRQGRTRTGPGEGRLGGRANPPVCQNRSARRGQSVEHSGSCTLADSTCIGLVDRVPVFLGQGFQSSAHAICHRVQVSVVPYHPPRHKVVKLTRRSPRPIDGANATKFTHECALHPLAMELQYQTPRSADFMAHSMDRLTDISMLLVSGL